MIENNTLFILGAGAHMPYGFPSGQKLVSDLLYGFTDQNYSKEHFSIDENISDIFLKNRIWSPGVINRFINALKKSGRISIDKFLRNQSNGWDDVGKRLIGFIISLYESKCDPFSGVQEGFHDYSESIYHYLFEKMDAIDDEKITENNIRFITFNYDRCLEHFFTEAVRVNYPNELKEFKKFLSRNVIHVHGSISPLENKTDSVEEGVPYGVVYNHQKKSFQINLNNYGFLGQDIRIVSDKVQSEILGNCIEFFKWAKRIIFLGFAYDKQNLENIGLDGSNRNLLRAKGVYGTMFGMKAQERKQVINYFSYQQVAGSLNFDDLGAYKSVEYLRDTLIL